MQGEAESAYGIEVNNSEAKMLHGMCTQTLN